MNIELEFLKKAIKDRNFISFLYENESFDDVKPLKLVEKNNFIKIHTSIGIMDFDKIKKLNIKKNKF